MEFHEQVQYQPTCILFTSDNCRTVEASVNQP